ncbi:AAA family ATPase [Kutzneria sp. 744]|uniref:AAA family ATPase n=1 Tax=Kutzneria sp. (strain 744) TaxID=345341 RepID=UPI0003EEE04C|nr:AAA family ATPase [Kutzneria sp. 744]EWM15851.1 hypothetical protein KUTG_06155 [Kutzneria sp. 744]
MAPRFDITRVRLRNYKSIESCDVELGPLTLLVGPNGSGKSNFLDALQFVADALNTNLENAIQERGGFGRVSRFGDSEVEITLEVRLGDRLQSYGIVLTPLGDGGCRLREEIRPTPDVAEALARLRVFTLVPDRMRGTSSPAEDDQLSPDGSTISAVLARIERETPENNRRAEDYLRVVVAEGVSAAEFDARSLSNGTLHAVGVFVALFDGTAPVAVENPEKGLHPAAVGALMDALRDGADRRQVFVTTHSADLLDVPGLDSSAIRAARRSDGSTVVGPLGFAGETSLRESLFTAGALLRTDWLWPAGVG